MTLPGNQGVSGADRKQVNVPSDVRVASSDNPDRVTAGDIKALLNSIMTVIDEDYKKRMSTQMNELAKLNCYMDMLNQYSSWATANLKKDGKVDFRSFWAGQGKQFSYEITNDQGKKETKTISMTGGNPWVAFDEALKASNPGSKGFLNLVSQNNTNKDPEWHQKKVTTAIDHYRTKVKQADVAIQDTKSFRTNFLSTMEDLRNNMTRNIQSSIRG